MKRIKLTHGTARVEDNCSTKTIKALDELSKKVFNMGICNYCGKTEICEGSAPEGCFLEHQIAKEKELQLEIISAKLFIKQKHNGEIPYKFGSHECAKMMALYLIENTREMTTDELIKQIQYGKKP